MSILDGLLAGIVADPLEETRWLVLADWLEEYDDPRRAELLRLHRRLLATCCELDPHPERVEWQARMVALLATVGGRGENNTPFMSGRFPPAQRLKCRW